MERVERIVEMAWFTWCSAPESSAEVALKRGEEKGQSALVADRQSDKDKGGPTHRAEEWRGS
jgi:hypothetical protein